ncbi:hypothetical protein DL93DRAFT_1700286 [Clavulina sp. PMI_390]|nr:hypothetical protein DL93DRAFT_1700286 [Clavulina sp. PMI_390]
MGGFPTPFYFVSIYPEEVAARQSALEGLKRVWTASKLPLIGGAFSAKVDLDDLWLNIQAVFRGEDLSRPPPTSDPRSVSALIKGGIIKVLANLVITYAVHTKLIKLEDFMVS